MPAVKRQKTRPLVDIARELDLPVAPATTLGLSLDPVRVAVDRLEKKVANNALPGFLTCIVKDGQLVHFEARGFADVCAQVPMSPDTLFRLYSQTKPITVAGALRLVERKALDLNDPVSKYIPAFDRVLVGEIGVLPHRQVLVRDLLGHTSGIGFGPGFGYEPENDYEEIYMALVRRVDERSVTTLEAWCDELAKLPLRFHPGEDWGYGYSSDVLGRVVEVASKRPLDEFLLEEVLTPLGMEDTRFAVPTNKANRLAALYKREPWDGSGRRPKLITADPGGSGLTQDFTKDVLGQSSEGYCTRAPSSSVFLEGQSSSVLQGGGCVCSVAGGLVSSMKDYLRFGEMLLNDGEFRGVRILSPESVALLRKDWLNEFNMDKRLEPLWVWDAPGIGFSPLGQIGTVCPEVRGRRRAGAALGTVHWGGAGGSGYMLSWPHHIQVLTYTGCTYDTRTQEALWKATFDGLALHAKAKKKKAKATAKQKAAKAKAKMKTKAKATAKATTKAKAATQATAKAAKAAAKAAASVTPTKANGVKAKAKVKGKAKEGSMTVLGADSTRPKKRPSTAP